MLSAPLSRTARARRASSPGFGRRTRSSLPAVRPSSASAGQMRLATSKRRARATSGAGFSGCSA